MIKICEFCKKEYKALRARQKFCKKKCSVDYYNFKNLDRIEKLLPEIIDFKKNHSLDDTADHFHTTPKTLHKFGLYYKEKHLSCPNLLSDLQQEFINGNLLGDGSCRYLVSSRTNSLFSIGQDINNKEYIQELFKVYSPFTSRIFESIYKKPDYTRKTTRTLKNSKDHGHTIAIHTISHPIFTELRKKWYKEPYQKNSQKIIPEDLRLTWRTAAVWMCDDGTNFCNTRSRSLTLHTNCFLKSHVELLIHKIKTDLDIKSSLYEKKKGQFAIYIGSDEWFKFTEQIKPYIPWQCLQYKCRNRLKTSGDNSSILEFLKSREKQN